MNKKPNLRETEAEYKSQETSFQEITNRKDDVEIDRKEQKSKTKPFQLFHNLDICIHECGVYEFWTSLSSLETNIIWLFDNLDKATKLFKQPVWSLVASK